VLSFLVKYSIRLDMCHTKLNIPIKTENTTYIKSI